MEEKSLEIKFLILSVMPIEDNPGSVQMRGFFTPCVLKTSGSLVKAPFSK